MAIIINKDRMPRCSAVEIANRLQAGMGKEEAYRVAQERFAIMSQVTDGDVNRQFFRAGEPLYLARVWQNVVGVLKKRQPVKVEAA